MSSLNVARRYAEALIEVAAENDRVDLVGRDLHRLQELLHANDDQLFAVLASPVFTAEERERVLGAVLPSLDLADEVVNVALVMSKNQRLGLIDLMVEAYDHLADERAGRVRATILTAEPLSPQLESEIKAALEGATGKEVYVEHAIDPALIGGMVARVGGKVYDSSIRTRLDQLRRSLIAAEA